MGLWQPKPAQERRCLLQLQLWRRRRLDHQRKRRTRRKRCRRRFGSFPSPPLPIFFPISHIFIWKKGEKSSFSSYLFGRRVVWGIEGGREENDGKVDFFRGKSKQLHFLRYVRARGEVRLLELREMRGSRPSIDE